jgi:hypothetical protein
MYKKGSKRHHATYIVHARTNNARFAEVMRLSLSHARLDCSTRNHAMPAESNRKGNARVHYDSPSTPARPRSISPTPIPSAPARSLISRSRSSRRFAAVPRTRSATRSAVVRYCSILCTPSVKRSMFGSRERLSLVRCVCRAAVVVKMKAEEGCDVEDSTCAWSCSVD